MLSDLQVGQARCWLPRKKTNCLLLGSKGMTVLKVTSPLFGSHGCPPFASCIQLTSEVTPVPGAFPCGVLWLFQFTLMIRSTDGKTMLVSQGSEADQEPFSGETTAQGGSLLLLFL